MRKIKLTQSEKQIENALLQGEYINIDAIKFKSIAETIASRKKDSVLNIRMNSRDLQLIKRKAQQFGIKYQTFISELLHSIAHG